MKSHPGLSSCALQLMRIEISKTLQSVQPTSGSEFFKISSHENTAKQSTGEIFLAKGMQILVLEK